MTVETRSPITTRLVAGLLVVGAGVAFLVDNLGWADVIAGGLALIFGRDRERRIRRSVSDALNGPGAANHVDNASAQS